jgi:hypothetical protein
MSFLRAPAPVPRASCMRRAVLLLVLTATICKCAAAVTEQQYTSCGADGAGSSCRPPAATAGIASEIVEVAQEIQSEAQELGAKCFARAAAPPLPQVCTLAVRLLRLALDDLRALAPVSTAPSTESDVTTVIAVPDRVLVHSGQRVTLSFEAPPSFTAAAGARYNPRCAFAFVG